MADPKAKTYDELAIENATLRATVARLEASVSSLQSTGAIRDGELARLRKPATRPRVLDPDAEDAFQRPARFR